MNPMIGITVNYDPRDEVGLASAMGLNGQDWHFVSGDYIYAVERAGGIPAVIPRCEDGVRAEQLADRLDALLVTGGHDVDPHSYGQRISGLCGRIIPERDAWEIALIRAFYSRKKPILAICRGIQMMNAVFGGDLYQDIMQEGGFPKHFMDASPREYPVHRVTFIPGSRLYEVYGGSAEVNSFHHQAVKTPCPCGRVTAVSEDGLPEGLELSGGHPFTVGVQWHPEMMFTDDRQQALFRAFVRSVNE